MSTWNASNHGRTRRNPPDASNASSGATSLGTARERQTPVAPAPRTTACPAAGHSKPTTVYLAKMTSMPVWIDAVQNTSNDRKLSMQRPMPYFPTEETWTQASLPPRQTAPIVQTRRPISCPPTPKQLMQTKLPFTPRAPPRN